MRGDDMAIAGQITMKVMYSEENEGQTRANEREAVGNDPSRIWGSPSLPDNSPFFNINYHALVFAIPRGYNGATEPGGGWAPHGGAAFAGLARPPNVKTDADVARAYPVLGTAFLTKFSSNPGNYEDNLTVNTWAGLGMLPALAPVTIEPATFLKMQRPPVDREKAEEWEAKRHVTTLDPRGKYPPVLVPASPWDGVMFLQDSMRKYFNEGRFRSVAPTALFDQHSSMVGTSSQSRDRDTDVALMQQHLVMTSGAVLVRALADAGVITINRITSKGAWERALNNLPRDHYGSASWDDTTSRFVVPNSAPGIVQAKNDNNAAFSDVLQLLGLVSTGPSMLGTQAGFNNEVVVARVLGAIFNASVNADKKAAFSAEALMPGASGGNMKGTVDALQRNINAAYPNFVRAVMDATSEGQRDVCAFSHTGSHQGGAFAAQLC